MRLRHPRRRIIFGKITTPVFSKDVSAFPDIRSIFCDGPSIRDCSKPDYIIHTLENQLLIAKGERDRAQHQYETILLGYRLLWALLAVTTLALVWVTE